MAKSRILIFENEDVVAHDLKSTIEGLGFEVPAIASTAEQAVACVRELLPDLVLMDVVITGEWDGIDAATTIQQELKIPVILITADTGEAILEQVTITEPYGYIVKPFQERVLHSTIKMALHRSRAERRIAHLNSILRAIRKINQLIVQEKDRQLLIERACECLTETRGYYNAWIALYDQAGALSFSAGSGMGAGIESLEGMIRAADAKRDVRYASAAPCAV